MDKPDVFDLKGQKRDWNWLQATFGTVRLERPETSPATAETYRVARLEAAEGPTVFIVTATDHGGNPLQGIQVARHWPGAPELPYLPPPASLWHQQGVCGATGAQGQIGFVAGVGDEYALPNSGVSAIWVADPSGPSDMVSGIGMLASGQHLHLNVVFRREPVAAPEPDPAPSPAPGPPPPPEPPVDERWATVFEKLDLLIALLEDRLKKQT